MESPWLIYMHAINRQHELARQAREERLPLENRESCQKKSPTLNPWRDGLKTRVDGNRDLSLLRNKTISL